MVNGYAPTSLQEALKLRAEHDVIPYAGGTDLMVENRRNAEYLFLNRIPELKRIRTDDDAIRIGAAVTFTEALSHPAVPKLIKEAVSRIAAPAIRNAGTFGGNLGNGSAKADSVVAEYAADAKLRLVSEGGERIIDVDRFYLGRKKLDLRRDELIAEVLLPKHGLDRYYYEKVGGRRALAVSRVTFAGVFDCREGRITNVAVAFGAVADTVLRYRELEAMLIGKTIGEAKALRGETLRAYAGHMAFTPGRVSADYRRDVCMNLLDAFLTKYLK